MAALAGTAAGIKIIAMMPTPDPNENNRLPDKIPNIPTPQEKWFKWLWEKREMRFEYRPLEFVRAYADKYLEGDAKCVKVGYDYVYNNSVENMKLSECIYVLFALTAVNSSVAPGSSVTNADVKLDPVGGAAAPLPDITIEGSAKSSEPKHTCPTYHSRLSDISTKVPSDGSNAGSDGDAEFAPKVAPQTFNINEQSRLTEAKLLFCQFLLENSVSAVQRKKYAIKQIYEYDGNNRLITFIGTQSFKADFQQMLNEISAMGFNIIWDACNHGVLASSSTVYYFSFASPYIDIQKQPVKFSYLSNNAPKDQARNTLIKAALQNPSAPFPAELTALGFSWFPKAATQPITTHNPTISTAYHTGASSTPSVASLTQELNFEREKVAAQAVELNAAKASNKEFKAEIAAKDTIITDQAAELKRTKAELADLKQKQQRCTCGAK